MIKSTKKNIRVLGLKELMAIAMGGMIGGGVFTILGISVSMIGFMTPVAFVLGGIIASFAAYSYVKLGLYYKDEGATYAFVKRTYPKSPFWSALVGWYVIFGYISTLAIFAYTFASYVLSSSEYADDIWMRKFIAWAVLSVFALINAWSVKGMGKIEDIMVYTKLLILLVISVILILHGKTNMHTFMLMMSIDAEKSGLLNILIVASLSFVAYEGFQLVINAVKEMKNPEKNTPRAIYGAIAVVIFIYSVISIGALFAIPIKKMIKYKEYALASGAGHALGNIGIYLVILGAVLATSSAINGTLFGSSRQFAEIAEDGYFPKFLSKRKNNIPQYAIILMAGFASLLILVGGLRLLVEFGSFTFILVSLVMSIINFQIRAKTNSSSLITITAIIILAISAILILYYEFTHKWQQMTAIITVYILLTLFAWLYAKRRQKNKKIIND